MRCSDQTVTIHNSDGLLKASPNRVQVCRGNSVALKFSNRVDVGKARTKHQSSTPTATWLDVVSTSPDGIMISVPDSTTPMEYKYSLEIDGIGLLDPRIVVQ